ncbi:MAG TPA: CBS domain-containing protein [Anaerolineaceae bacterium]|nr:CBS domain-containing protein [Anaerolineaceae bacterium]
MNQKNHPEDAMDFTVREWMMTLIVYVDPDATVKEALSLMRRRYINSLVVKKTETNPEYGIVTTVDVCDKIIAQNRDPSKLKVRDIMTSPLISISQSASIQDCAKLMMSLKNRHLPVRDDETGELIGMVSATDFLVIAEAMAS